MVHILYLAHDLADPAVRRRVLMLRAGGAEVTLAGFRRADNMLAAIEDVVPIELGRTADGRFGQRIAAVLKACLSAGGTLRNVRRPDVILARNLEMLAVANRAAGLFAGDVPIVYECLDIHRLLLRKDFAGRALRSVEARLGRNVRLLITSSPAFVEHYFRPRSAIAAPYMLLENQVLDLGGEATTPPRPRPPAPGEPWKIGWFGAIRCRKSLAILSAFSRAMQGKVEIVLRGRPAYSEFDDFDAFVRDEPFLSYHGPYRNPEDLAAIYDEVQFSWAIDFFEEGLNSSWLLPNRLYEGCRYGAVPIAVKGTETAKFLASKGVGILLERADTENLEAAFGAMDQERYLEAFRLIADLGPEPWTFDRTDCAALVQRLQVLAGSVQTRAAPALSRHVATKVDYNEG
ncbi:MAG: glycosyl transferase family 1 [Shinella sp.]|nr:glycosyl transferase family 1 [Shinella sp.]